MEAIWKKHPSVTTIELMDHTYFPRVSPVQELQLESLDFPWFTDSFIAYAERQF